MSDNIANFESVIAKTLKEPDSFEENINQHLEPLTEEKLKALVQVLVSQSAANKQIVSQLLLKIDRDKVGAYLLKIINVDEPKLFIQAAHILGSLKYTDAVEKLHPAISGNYPELVMPSVKALAMMPASEKTTDILLNFLLKYPDELKLSASIKYLVPRQAALVPEIMKKYASLSADRKLHVLKFLSETGNESLTELFEKELARHPSESGIFCIAGLGGIGTAKAVQILGKNLDNKEWFIRKRIAQALGQSETPQAIPYLLKAISDESLQVRAAATESLSKIGNFDSKALIDALNKAGKTEKINLIKAMGHLKNPDFAQSLISMLKDRENLFFTIDALGEIKSENASLHLKKYLHDEIWFNRLNALEALKKQNHPDLQDFAKNALKDENDMVRSAAQRILET